MNSKWESIFILSVGRSGSNAFAKACSHISNYSAGHETRSWEIGASRLDYPNRHIESDNKLSWMLGLLDENYGNNAFYVHLIRNKEDVVKSWDKRWNHSFSNIRHFTEGVLSNVPDLLSESARQTVGEQHYDVVNANISLFLKDKTNVLIINLEEIENGFRKFWNTIGAEGNFEDALAEFSKQHNTNESSEVVARKEKLFRLDIRKKVLQKNLSSGGSVLNKLGWIVELLLVKFRLLLA